MLPLLSALLQAPAGAAEDTNAPHSYNDGLSLQQDLSLHLPLSSSLNSANLYGDEGGFFHPFISFTGVQSDNIYNSASNQIKDHKYIISPGIGLAWPGIRNVEGAAFTTSTFNPGGLLLSRSTRQGSRRLQTSLLYHADLERYAETSRADTDRHRVEGLFRLNSRSGLGIDLAGEYKQSADEFSGEPILEEYTSTLGDLLLSFDFSRKTSISLGASTYDIDYDLSIYDGRDRTDETYTGRLSYKPLVRMALFAEYVYIRVDYELQVFPDSTIQQPGLGIKWDITAKSSGEIKGGYSYREYPESTREKKGDLFLLLLASHNFTPKTSMQLIGVRRTTESMSGEGDYVLNHQGSLNYRQKFTRKFIAQIKATYSWDKYIETLASSIGNQERIDSTWMVSPSLEYLLTDWLSFSLSYGREERDSNKDALDYTTNTYLIRLTGYL